MDSLSLRLPDTHFEPAHIIATTGWTTANLSNAMDAQQIDTSTFERGCRSLIGVNNQYQGLPLDAYEVESIPCSSGPSTSPMAGMTASSW